MNAPSLFRRITSLLILVAFATPSMSRELAASGFEWDPYLQPSALTLFAANGQLAFSSDETRCNQAEAVRQEAIATYRRGDFEQSMKQVKDYLERLSELESSDARRDSEIRARLLQCQLELLLGRYDQVPQQLPDDSQWDRNSLRQPLAVAGSLRCEALFQQGYHRRALTELGEVREELIDGIGPDDVANVGPITLLLERQLSLQLANMAATYGQLQYAAACRVNISASLDAVKTDPESPGRLSEADNAVIECSLQELIGRIDRYSVPAAAAQDSTAKAIALRDKLGLPNDRRLVQLMFEAARVQMDSDAESESYDTSLKLLTRAEESLNELQLSHPIESARLSSLRAEIAIRQEEYAAGEELLRHSNSLLLDVNPHHPVTIVNNLNRLAIPSDMSRQNRAQMMAIEVAKLAESSVADAAHYSLESARIFEADGNAKAAEEMYAYAIKLLGPSCGPTSHTLAASVDELTDLYQSTGDSARAAGFLEVYLTKLETAPDVVHKPARIAEMRAYFEQKLERVRAVTPSINSR